MVPGASALVTPVLKPATRALAVALSMVPPLQAMSLLAAKEMETVSVVSMSSKVTVPLSLRF